MRFLRATLLSRALNRRSIGVLALALASISTVQVSRAQSADASEGGSQFSVGVTGAWTRNYHTGGFSGDGSMPPASESNSGSGFQAGIVLHYEFGPVLGASLRLVTDTRPGTMTQVYEAPIAMPDGMQTQRTEENTTIEYGLTTVDLSLSAAVVEIGSSAHIQVSAGPTVGFVNTSRFTRTHDLILPENVRFIPVGNMVVESDGRRIVYARNAEIPDVISPRVSLKGGIAVDADVLPLSIRLGAYYDYGLTDVTDSENWSLSSLIVQLDVMFEL